MKLNIVFCVEESCWKKIGESKNREFMMLNTVKWDTYMKFDVLSKAHTKFNKVKVLSMRLNIVSCVEESRMKWDSNQTEKWSLVCKEFTFIRCTDICTKEKFSAGYTRLVHCLPKFCHPNFHRYFYQNTSLCLHYLSRPRLH